jgi:hypothetical protein
MDDELVDRNAPHCPSCSEPMDVVVGAWWCLPCQETIRVDLAA